MRFVIIGLEAMQMFENLLWKLKRKGFYIDLDEDYAFPGKKGAVRPNVYAMQAAIENYCLQNDHTIKYLRKQEPIRFRLDGKEIYTAKLQFFWRGKASYVIHCQQWKEE